MAERIVAELGRPETPQETADRKAESSRAYRSSKTFRNLLPALLATMAIVVVVVLAVPRGQLAATPAPDVAALAQSLSASMNRAVIAPATPTGWTVNQAQVEGDSVSAWTIVYVPDSAGYLRAAQGFDADSGWVVRTLSGAASDGTLTIDGIDWTRYDISDPSKAGNVSYALATSAGKDTILLYGTATAAQTAELAQNLTAQIRTLREAAQ